MIYCFYSRFIKKNGLYSCACPTFRPTPRRVLGLASAWSSNQYTPRGLGPKAQRPASSALSAQCWVCSVRLRAVCWRWRSRPRSLLPVARACGRRRPDRSTRASAGWRRQQQQEVGEAAPPRGAARRPCRPPTTTPRPASCNTPFPSSSSPVSRRDAMVSVLRINFFSSVAIGWSMEEALPVCWAACLSTDN
jgi:hypothetical protein